MAVGTARRIGWVGTVVLPIAQAITAKSSSADDARGEPCGRGEESRAPNARVEEGVVLRLEQGAPARQRQIRGEAGLPNLCLDRGGGRKTREQRSEQSRAEGSPHLPPLRSE